MSTHTSRLVSNPQSSTPGSNALHCPALLDAQISASLAITDGGRRLDRLKGLIGHNPTNFDDEVYARITREADDY